MIYSCYDNKKWYYQYRKQEEFASSVAKGLTFLARNEAPYCIHCTEGKDRAGFTAAGLGVTLGAMGGVIGMTKDALSPVMQTSSEIGGSVVPPSADTWDCACGCKSIKSKFCPDCGSPKPAPVVGWDCTCGCKNITSKFCPECGSKKPEVMTWNCTCGCQNITSKFCPECGHKREG